jgi:hypothetical protein
MLRHTIGQLNERENWALQTQSNSGPLATVRVLLSLQLMRHLSDAKCLRRREDAREEVEEAAAAL